ncbi:MAG: 50S ribosome-binding GTPase [Clostridiales bacterium]|nr:50S ribosome-binding GTPase [Clostridiales bacterium]
MNKTTGLKTVDIEKKIELYQDRLLELYKHNGYTDDAKELRDELVNYGKENKIRLVFIGQYTSGKSTIISALTADDTIKIDSNIATDHATDYDWNNIVLTDTPGLYTENPDHDNKTIEMIKRSDLLVYCITSDLFNQYTKADFERWAFENNYSEKMFLVINKMSKEDGDYNSLVENYSSTLNIDLMPHSLNDIEHCFFDAKDYKVGVAEKNEDLIELSHFEGFIQKLNSFIDRKGLLGRLNKPIQILISSIDEVTLKTMKNDKDKAYFTLASRIANRIEKQRADFSYESRRIIRSGMSQIRAKGEEYAGLVGSNKTINEDKLRDFVEKACVEINNDLAKLCEESTNKLNQDLEELLHSQPAILWVRSLDSEITTEKRLFEKKETKVNRLQFDALSRVVKSVSGRTVELATKGKTKTAGFLLKSSEVTGSKLHSAVYEIGNKLGHKFKPWEAAKVTKIIGNAAKFLGPAIDTIAYGVQVKEMIDANKLEREIHRRQVQFSAYIAKVAEDLEDQYRSELQTVYNAYDEAIIEVQNEQQKVEAAINSNRAMSKEMEIIKTQLLELRNDIFFA